MNRLFFGFVAIASLFAVDSADACNRCGLFGNRCRFVSHAVVQQVAYTPPAVNQTQNFLFNNSYPVPYLAQQGSTAYGYSLVAEAYNVDPSLLFDRSSRFAELALKTAQSATDGFNSNAASALALADAADRRQKNTVLALSAIEANGQGSGSVASQSYTLRATVQNGKLSIEKIDPSQSPAADGNAATPGATAFVCGRCHDGKPHTPQPPLSLILDGTSAISGEQLAACSKAIMLGKMPPAAAGAGELSVDQKSETIANLARLLGK